MKNITKKRAFTLALFLAIGGMTTLQAQTGQGDFMRNIGKIYVVVAVMVAVFLGIVLFLVYLDRKLTKLENQIKEDD